MHFAEPDSHAPAQSSQESGAVKLALVAISTFGYFERLAEHASALGIDTVFFDERPDNSVRQKLLYRYAPRSVTNLISKRHRSDLVDRILAGGFTHALIVFAELISVDDVRRLKDHGVIVSRFTWDSLRNRPQVLQFDPLMRAIASFDPDDCATQGYRYIPLYSETVPEQLPSENDRTTDFYFCGTMHSNRPEIISEVMAISARRGWRSLMKLFYHSHWLYYLRNLTDRRALSLRKHISDVGFKHRETLADSANARVVIDIQHPDQSGLTMRTFEALAQGAVLLTTNDRILDLLDESLQHRVVILDRNDIEGSMERAIAVMPGPLNERQRHALSVNRFLLQIFELLGIAPPSTARTGSTS